ncbi:oxidoreductase, partial [Klebsiella pneumoniae]|nr:oxidoreductase [Klebsiella pneumoniae]
QALKSKEGMTLREVRDQIQSRMSDYAGFVCSADEVSRACEEAVVLKKNVYGGGLSISHVAEISELFMWRHLALTSAAVLT